MVLIMSSFLVRPRYDISLFIVVYVLCWEIPVFSA